MSLLCLTTRVSNLLKVSKMVNSAKYVRAIGNFAKLNNVRVLSTSINNKLVSKVDLTNKEAKSLCVKAPIPELRLDYDLEACYVIGNNYCYKIIGILDQELGSLAEDIVIEVGLLLRNSKKKGGKDTLTLSLNTHIYENFSKTEFLWKDMLQKLVEKQILEKNGTVGKTQEKRLGGHAIQDINMAIKNIEIMLVIRNSILYCNSQ